MRPTRWITESARKGLMAFLLVSFWVLLNCTGCYFPRRGVVLGEGFLDKQLFFEFPDGEDFPASGILSLSEVTLGEKGIRAIAVLGYSRGYCLDPDSGEVLESLSFEAADGVYRGAIVDLDGHGTLGVFTRHLVFPDVRLLNRKGQAIWKRSGDYDDPVQFIDGAVGDANGDAVPEFYLASTAGLHCLAATGETRWVVGQENEYWSVVFDQGVPGGEPPCLVATGSYRGRPGDFLELRSTNGDLISCNEKGEAPLDFVVLRWPTGERPLRILRLGRSKRTSGLWILDERGRTAGFWPGTDAYFARPAYVAGATFVRLDANDPPYLAVLFGYKHDVSQTLLTVYSLDGLLVYQEYLPPLTWGLLATRIERCSQSGEVLLVGGRGERVAVYTLGKSSE